MPKTENKHSKRQEEYYTSEWESLYFIIKEKKPLKKQFSINIKDTERHIKLAHRSAEANHISCMFYASAK